MLPGTYKHTCQVCGNAWQTEVAEGAEVASPDGFGIRSNNFRRLLSGTPCDCEEQAAKAAEEAETDARWAREREELRLEKAQRQAEFDALPQCRPDDTRTIEIIVDWETGRTQLVRVCDYLRSRPEARYAENRERVERRPGVQAAPDAMVWLFKEKAPAQAGAKRRR